MIFKSNTIYFILITLIISILIIVLENFTISQKTYNAAEYIRRYAKTPVVDFFEDMGQPPEIIVYMPGIDSSQSSRYIARANINYKTGLFEASFETEVKPGKVWGDKKIMTIENFAVEVERRAKVIDLLTDEAINASRGKLYDTRYFIVMDAPLCKNKTNNCEPYNRKWPNGIRPKNIWAITNNNRIVIATPDAVDLIIGKKNNQY